MVEEQIPKYFLEIAYNGTAYHGWQIQDNAVSVQEKLNQALSILLREEVETIGAGRTDSGVHAKQLFVHFSSKAKVLENKDRFVHSLNALMPFDISAKRLIEVDAKAHARFDATQRSYEYHVHFQKDPFLHEFSWQLRDKPDVEKMNIAALDLLGRQDFSCFSKSNTQVFTNYCDIKRAEWLWDGDRLVFHISADRFLRNMVRAIVGTLMEIGLGKKPIEHIKEVIQSMDRSKAGTSVPACGLYLTEVNYPYID
ncbi:tRNA pseudouridine synthase A [Sphingobacterium mizutaii NBRC 14946 = DSM 11724]|uniref:tRNA pseudouridine synthase A n=2 Tax=Sphingobacterium mizutaii TaxID=1010 RepID=A0AAJ4X821_9SPHI|nr:tRNA pseudouridine(38-40) synthase TruA [Sphingobacterium mizutaii]GEM67024.1 tRNA pseudouridine synthase A [Sphingobacterium mizutaii NBRC 14946 = DSM 11724]SDL63322.1 tRNA pseudouridine38-40 synthase [Sphingobacterium mizutaii]SNV36320.1 tRNA pseudouridine synthase A [Sphingobacterium mizutaii]